ncbi:MAG: hypothetical protein KH415_17935 [Clostridium sp.]|nr:hypothetical protein [Clostridium sp.]
MFIRKKTLLTMIEVTNGEIASLKKRVSELEARNTSKEICFDIGGEEIGRIMASKVSLATTEPIASFDSKGITINGGIFANGKRGI